MSTVEEHFAILRAMGPQGGGWLTDPFHLASARFLGAHLDELEAAWAQTKALTAATANPTSLPTRTPEELEALLSLALGALEPFGMAWEDEKDVDYDDTMRCVIARGMLGPEDFRQASQVIAQIKGGQG